MADKSKIQWTEATWNPVIGCRRVSTECLNCYAEVQAKRIALMHPGSAYGDVLRVRDGKLLPMWNGKAITMPDRLDQPLRWQRPRLIFVNSMSDLFHDDVPFDYIAAVFGVMAASPRHTFQVLTKRPQRMLQFFAWLDSQPSPGALRDPRVWWCGHNARVNGCDVHMRESDKPAKESRNIAESTLWPLPNVHLGVSAGNQEGADERIPLLLQAPAAVRWVSAEPLLGPIDFGALGDGSWLGGTTKLDWIVVGGESGSGARACDINAVRGVVEQCREAGVPVHVKQLGAWSVDPELGDVIGPDGSVHYTRSMEGAKQMLAESARLDPETGERTPAKGYRVEAHRIRLKHPKGGDMDEWPSDLRVREWPLVETEAASC